MDPQASSFSTAAAAALISSLPSEESLPSLAEPIMEAPVEPVLPVVLASAEAPPAAPANDSASDEELKKAQKRERNRLHAVASRKRRREKMDQLERDNESLKRKIAQDQLDRDALAARLQAVEQENRQLRAAWADHLRAVSADSFKAPVFYVPEAAVVPAPASPPIAQRV
mmetsp:Transcript_25216/g.75697  ORF Transcript_25216/g.75697 Transcript_25216/m.75697 type:complete len:170 (+) Transcript_25216:138-647(+)|eukprot:CAMPEP_0119270286 /NCGR_PEP_ID=MMETSP1329-20130426/7347_1 /TAXON_ID=114041 /ORGANISM="Genus nov. species nov., Strain RCC1024" /LENGTH=169 /DNA_ID=CAMNT_0007270303 /DNA_START=128 /DNA_END=637 /DNA_ORIENTATION=+